MTESTESNAPEVYTKPKHRILWFLLKFFLIFFITIFFIQKCSHWYTEKDTKNFYISTNSNLLQERVQINDVKLNYNQGNTIINGFYLSNPDGFEGYAFKASEIGLYAENLAIREILTNPTAAQKNQTKIQKVVQQKTQQGLLYSYKAIIKNAEINYNYTNGQVNLHKILDDIIRTLNQNPNQSILSLFNNDTEFNLNYTGNKFKLDAVIIITPTINIYQNNQLIKTYNSEKNIILKFNDIKRPTTYGHYLLAGSFKLVNILDNLTK